MRLAVVVQAQALAVAQVQEQVQVQVLERVENEPRPKCPWKAPRRRLHLRRSSLREAIVCGRWSLA